MLKHLPLILTLLCAVQMHGQINFVPNGSFELLDTCPYSESQIRYSSPWFSPSLGTPDLYSECWGVPINSAGFQYAKDGVGYAGILTYIPGPGPCDGREYVAVKLKEPLIKNRFYCFSMYCSIFDTFYWAYTQQHVTTTTVCTSSSIDAFFSSDSIFQSTGCVLSFTPQIHNSDTNPINDFDSWVKVSGMFKANGFEQYMYIGNFNSNANTQLDTINIGTEGPPWIYFYIDDISLVECEGVGIEESNINPLKIFPNPAHENVSITLPKGINNAQLFIYNIQGQKLRQENINLLKTISVNDLPNGLYLFTIQNNGAIIGKQRIIVAH